MLPGPREGQTVLLRRPASAGLAADSQLTVSGLDGSEVRLPVESRMPSSTLISLFLGGV